MASIKNVVKSPIKGKVGTIYRSSGYQYRDFWYKNASGQNVHVVGWHRAVDITTLGEVVAFAKGKVVSIVKGITGQTTNPSGGNSVTLLHGNGCKTTYCHLDNGSNNHLKLGDIVEEGAKLGTDVIKTTGNSTGLHLHFAIYNPNETYQGSHYMNPIDYLQGTKKLIGYGGSTKPSADISSKSIDELAKEVIAGKYGNGQDRRNALGLRYSEVQSRVNEILNGNKPASKPTPQPEEPKKDTSDDLLTLVKKTIRGDFGSGQTRKNKLGSRYSEVQRQVNLNIQHGLTRWDNIRLF